MPGTIIGKGSTSLLLFQWKIDGTFPLLSTTPLFKGIQQKLSVQQKILMKNNLETHPEAYQVFL